MEVDKEGKAWKWKRGIIHLKKNVEERNGLGSRKTRIGLEGEKRDRLESRKRRIG